MIKSILLSATILFSAFAADETQYTVNPKTSNVHWLGKKTTGQHEGDVSIKSGNVSFNGTDPVSGDFVLDMKTITCTDIKNADDNQSLVDHLKNEDFFNVAQFPEASLKIIKFEKTETANTYNVTADLTIKGVKNQISFPAVVTPAKATATITIDRTKWNISYKSKSILGSVADKFIYDDVQFSISLALGKGK